MVNAIGRTTLKKHLRLPVCCSKPRPAVARLGVVGALIAGALACSCSATESRTDATAMAASEEQVAPVIAVHRWAARMPAGQAVSIANDHGDIRIKLAGDSGLHYAGTAQKLNGETRDPDFRADKVAGGLALSVSAPADWQGRVDAGVRVPADSPLTLRTGAGLIQVRAGANDIDARSDSGNIALRTSGRITASSIAGDIRATFQNTRYTQTAGSLETQTGDVEIWVRPDSSLVIDLSASRVVNRLPAGIGRMVTTGDGRTMLSIGEGGATLVVSSEQGVVSIDPVPLPVIVAPDVSN
jgi:hypothetical protein